VTTGIVASPEMEDIDDFINENEITMHVLLAHENPYRNRGNQQGINWSCKIINSDNKYIVIYFSKGAAIRQWCQSPEIGFGDTIPLHIPHHKINKRYDGPLPPFENERDKRTFQFCSQVEPPFLAEVLEVLARDICLVEQAGSFERWAEALKTSSDSRAAKTAFDIICQQRIELTALLGEGACHKLLYEIDRVPEIEPPTKNNEENT